MLQVDVFSAFSLGALLAAMAGDNLKKTESMFVNKYFVYAVCYLSMVVAPTAAYLLWQYPGWETLFYFDSSLDGIVVLLFAHTNVSLGVLGFCIGYKLIKNGEDLSVHKYWTTSFTCFTAILFFSYDRSLYAGTLEEFKGGVEYNLADFFNCKVFHTLLVMGIFIIPPQYYAMIAWPVAYRITPQQKSAMIAESMKWYLGSAAFVLAGFTILLCFSYLPNSWGFDRAVAFIIGHITFGVIVFGPLFIIPTSQKRVE